MGRTLYAIVERTSSSEENGNITAVLYADPSLTATATKKVITLQKTGQIGKLINRSVVWSTSVVAAEPTVAQKKIALVETNLHAFMNQCDAWAVGLAAYGGLIQSKGNEFLVSARQAAIDYAQDTAYSLDIRAKGLLGAKFGATDITSPPAFAGAIDQFGNAAITTKILWITRATGERTGLAARQSWGSLDANFKVYSRPSITA